MTPQFSKLGQGTTSAQTPQRMQTHLVFLLKIYCHVLLQIIYKRRLLKKDEKDEIAMQSILKQRTTGIIWVYNIDV